MKSLRSIAMLGVFAVLAASGQTFRGGITGIITDESGAVIDSAIVKASSQGTGLV